jgi:hypothetical protein
MRQKWLPLPLREKHAQMKRWLNAEGLLPKKRLSRLRQSAAWMKQQRPAA